MFKQVYRGDLVECYRFGSAFSVVLRVNHNPSLTFLLAQAVSFSIPAVQGRTWMRWHYGKAKSEIQREEEWKTLVCVRVSMHVFETVLVRSREWADWFRQDRVDNTTVGWMPITHINNPIYSHNAVNCKRSAAIKAAVCSISRCQGQSTSQRALCGESVMFSCICRDIQSGLKMAFKHISRWPS